MHCSFGWVRTGAYISRAPFRPDHDSSLDSTRAPHFWLDSYLRRCSPFRAIACNIIFGRIVRARIHVLGLTWGSLGWASKIGFGLEKLAFFWLAYRLGFSFPLLRFFCLHTAQLRTWAIGEDWLYWVFWASVTAFWDTGTFYILGEGLTTSVSASCTVFFAASGLEDLVAFTHFGLKLTRSAIVWALWAGTRLIRRYPTVRLYITLLLLTEAW